MEIKILSVGGEEISGQKDNVQGKAIGKNLDTKRFLLEMARCLDFSPNAINYINNDLYAHEVHQRQALRYTGIKKADSGKPQIPVWDK